MAQAKEKLKTDIALLEKALDTLNQALCEPLTEIVRDAVIQRFEYVFELSWKTVRAAANYMGIVVVSPREAIKTAFKQGWISEPEQWLEAMEARNRTSHTYDLILAESVYQVTKTVPRLVKELLLNLKRISD